MIPPYYFCFAPYAVYNCLKTTKKSFRKEKYKSETTLSKYLWDNGLQRKPKITWKILKKCSTYGIGQKSCDLCLSEKLYIIKNFQNPT